MIQKPFRTAVVLAGCGSKDGSEIHESVCTLLAIDRLGGVYQCFAPDMEQYQVINFLTDEVVEEKRNTLLEAARIARGDIKPLSEFQADDFDALMIPGGLGGAAMNLSSFARDGEHMTVHPELEAAIKALRAQGKPIAALCIAPVILAKLIPGVEVTFGQSEDVNAIARKWGAIPKNTTPGEIVVDQRHKVATAPCYMLETHIRHVADEAEKCVRALAGFLS